MHLNVTRLAAVMRIKGDGEHEYVGSEVIGRRAAQTNSRLPRNNAIFLRNWIANCHTGIKLKLRCFPKSRSYVANLNTHKVRRTY